MHESDDRHGTGAGDAPATAPPPTGAGAGRGARPPGARVLAVAASTGGPNALALLLSRLPADFPIPTVVVQHMPARFTAALAERLRRATGRPCAEACDGEPVLPGRTYLAPGDQHLTLATRAGETVARLDRGPPVHFCRPSADPLFTSVAELYGAATLAVVLTGMGGDGLEGCRAVARAGGRILVQDEESSVVWGMPGAVWRAGLAAAALPLEPLAERIGRLASRPGRA